MPSAVTCTQQALVLKLKKKKIISLFGAVAHWVKILEFNSALSDIPVKIY